jgi:glycosyltransferase involved in cell wall biosynthesis
LGQPTAPPFIGSLAGAGKWPAFIVKAYEGLAEAGVLSGSAWARHPFRTSLRLIPLRVKETVNQFARRPVFDLSFYLQFQPSSLENTGVKVTRLRNHLPELGERRRVAFITPHLGPGGAENVLLDMARSLDRNSNEIFLIATHSRDSRCVQMWQQHADHVYDLASLVEPEALPSALYSLILNWEMNTVVIQNTLIAYSVIPHCKRELPALRVIDLIHTVGTGWDIAAATATVASDIDTRIVISEAARKNLIALGTSERKIRHIQNGVDLEHFRPVAAPDGDVFRILFAARLDPVKRPLLLVDIARELELLRPASTFRFVVAGDGPEEGALRRRIRAARLEHLFELHGQVEDLAPLLAGSAVLLVTSSNEGIPLTILEAFATARPVIASRAGAIDEILDETTGILIDTCGDEASRFAQAILTFMNAPALRQRMGVEARRSAERKYDRCEALQQYRDALSACAS